MAARDSSPRPLQKAMRLVKEAIQLDTRNRQKVQTRGAFCFLKPSEGCTDA
uniref:Uncharacterized protein n=1 Tax=Electrophorus electricus TaxID=8005 RepID=A0A4W4FPK0_ELEEL